MKTEIEKNRKRIAFLMVLTVTGLGAFLLSQAVSGEDRTLREPMDGGILLGMGIFLMGMYALVFVNLFERVKIRSGPVLNGAVFGTVIWMLSAFPIFLFVSASGARSVEDYLIASLGSLALFLSNGLLTGWLLRGVSTKALTDDTTAIG